MSFSDPTTMEVVIEDSVLETESRPFYKDVWRRFRRNKLAVIAITYLILLLLVAIFADLIAPYGEAERTDVYRGSPSEDHWFGTDIIGRDVFSRIVLGSRVSLRIAFLATGIATFFGMMVGAVSGYFGGRLDNLIMRFTDIFLAIPYIVLAIAIASVAGRSENSIILVLGLLGILPMTRIVRASFLSLREMEYADAAKALGFKRSRIMFRHILPNALQPLIIYATISVGGVILAEAALSFLGVGPQDPTPAWGLMVAQGKGDLANAPHLVFFPGLAISSTVLAFVLIGDGLRDALDPKLK